MQWLPPSGRVALKIRTGGSKSLGIITLEELNNCSREELITIVLMMQGQLDTLNENIERLIEQVRIANSYRFGKHAETLDSIDGQLSFFDEAESCCDLSVPEPAAEEVLPSRRNHKKKGQREMNLKDFPEEILPPYQVSTEELDTFYGAGNWRRMKDETYKRLRHEPESWTVEVHTVEVYVGTGGDHQDEFLRGKRPRDLLRGSIVTPSLLASILNVKYVNSSALHRVEQEFQRNGVNISRQTMSNWIIRCAEKYFAPFVERMKQELLSLPVTQSDETPTQVIGDSDRPNSKCYMWIHRSGEFYKERPVAIYEYQKGRDHEKPLVEDFFAWAKQQAAECAVPPKSRTGQGLNFVIHQEKYLKVFLTDGDIPIDNSASERAIRTSCIGKKNWMFHNTAKGAGASTLVYSISETAKLNNLRPYYYFRHILTELPKYCDEKGNIDPAKLDHLMPWAEELPEECRKPRCS